MHVDVGLRIIVLPNNNPKVNLDYYPEDVYVYYDHTISAKFGKWWEYTVNP